MVCCLYLIYEIRVKTVPKKKKKKSVFDQNDAKSRQFSRTADFDMSRNVTIPAAVTVSPPRDLFVVV